MKRFILFLIIFIQACCEVNAQIAPDSGLVAGTSSFTPQFRYGLLGGKFVPYIYNNQTGKYYPLYTAQTNNYYFYPKSHIDSALSSAGGTIAGGAISSLPTVGFNPGSGLTASQWIAAVYYQSQPPTANLTGGATLRITSAATTSVTLNYSYGKQSATANIASATIGGSTAGVTQSATGASGTYAVNVPTNAFASTSYTLTVTTIDNKSASSTTPLGVQNDRFWGRSAISTPDASTITAAAGGGSGLSGSHAGTFTVIASGSNYPFFAHPSRIGTITQIKDGSGLDATSAFTKTVVSVTTVGGYTENYDVWTLNNATAGNYTFTTN